LEQTPIAKILPPSRPAGYIARPALASRVSTVLQRRLTVVVAGRVSASRRWLATWWEGAACAWYPADRSDRDLPSFAKRLSDALRLRLPDLPSELDRLDRYDEEAHLGLVSAMADAGRHGEAHRHYLNYRRAMDDLSLEPASFPRGNRELRSDENRRTASRLS
jgi:hypothetical protein